MGKTSEISHLGESGGGLTNKQLSDSIFHLAMASFGIGEPEPITLQISLEGEDFDWRAFIFTKYLMMLIKYFILWQQLKTLNFCSEQRYVTVIETERKTSFELHYCLYQVCFNNA